MKHNVREPTRKPDPFRAAPIAFSKRADTESDRCCGTERVWLARLVWGNAPHRKFLEIRCSEIASEAILGQKQSRVARGVLLPIFGCPCMHLLGQLTSNFHERRY